MRKLTPAETVLHTFLGKEFDRIKARFLNPKLTLIVRNPDVPDGDVVLTDDDPEAAIAALETLIAEEKP